MEKAAVGEILKAKYAKSVIPTALVKAKRTIHFAFSRTRTSKTRIVILCMIEA